MKPLSPILDNPLNLAKPKSIPDAVLDALVYGHPAAAFDAPVSETEVAFAKASKFVETTHPEMLAKQLNQAMIG